MACGPHVGRIPCQATDKTTAIANPATPRAKLTGSTAVGPTTAAARGPTDQRRIPRPHYPAASATRRAAASTSAMVGTIRSNRSAPSRGRPGRRPRWRQADCGQVAAGRAGLPRDADRRGTPVVDGLKVQAEAVEKSHAVDDPGTMVGPRPMPGRSVAYIDGGEVLRWSPRRRSCDHRRSDDRLRHGHIRSGQAHRTAGAPDHPERLVDQGRRVQVIIGPTDQVGALARLFLV